MQVEGTGCAHQAAINNVEFMLSWSSTPNIRRVMSGRTPSMKPVAGSVSLCGTIRVCDFYRQEGGLYEGVLSKPVGSSQRWPNSQHPCATQRKMNLLTAKGGILGNAPKRGWEINSECFKNRQNCCHGCCQHGYQLRQED